MLFQLVSVTVATQLCVCVYLFDNWCSYPPFDKMWVFIATIVVIIASCAYLYNRKSRTSGVLPPGPRGLPLIGNLHQFSKNASTTLSEWAKQYGKLYTIHMGTKPTLVINDAILMRQLFGQTAATGKFRSEVFNVIFKGPYGILNTEGAEWSEQRAFFQHSLKMAGIGRTTKMDSIAFEEIEKICDVLEEEMRQQGKVFLSEPFKTAVGDTIWGIMTEEKTKTNLAELLDAFLASLEKVTNSGLAFFSWVKDIAPRASGYTEFVKAIGNIHEFLQKRFDDPKRITGEHKDLIQGFMAHNQSMQDKNSSFYGEEGRKHCFGSVLSLLTAGTETTSTMMHFLVFYMTAHPEVQRKVQSEIEEIIGEDRDPTLEDRRRMPYLEAVIEETLRMAAPTPFGVILSTLEEMTFEGYTLPKGLLLLPNIYHILSDPKVWGDPENFRPERFMDEEGSSTTAGTVGDKKKALKEYMVAFQPGKRVCPGEQLGRDTMFLFTIKLLRKFTFTPESGRDRAEYMEKRFSYVQMPKKIGVVATVRRS